jgi:small subunit ribosomal protein S9
MILDKKADIYRATGRRKRAIARVRLARGEGKIAINGRELKDFCAHESFARAINAPLAVSELEGQIDLDIKVIGGGTAGQGIAIAHGIARSLEKMNAELRKPLKKAGHIRRDPRKKERKKPGQPGARKKFQFSKR